MIHKILGSSNQVNIVKYVAYILDAIGNSASHLWRDDSVLGFPSQQETCQKTSVYIQQKLLPWACLKIKECTESWPWILGDLSGHGWNGGREWHFKWCWSHGSAGQCELLSGRVCSARSSRHEYCTTYSTNSSSICTGVYFDLYLFSLILVLFTVTPNLHISWLFINILQDLSDIMLYLKDACFHFVCKYQSYQ